MTDKPLSETHPTFTAKHNMMMSWGEMNMLRLSRCIRETTVDIAEYERLKKELESAWVTINDLDVRLERAVAEHEKLYSKGFDAGVKETHGRVEHVGYQEGIMRRLKLVETRREGKHIFYRVEDARVLALLLS